MQGVDPAERFMDRMLLQDDVGQELSFARDDGGAGVVYEDTKVS